MKHNRTEKIHEVGISASQKVLENSGFTREGVLRQALWGSQGSWVDAIGTMMASCFRAMLYASYKAFMHHAGAYSLNIRDAHLEAVARDTVRNLDAFDDSLVLDIKLCKSSKKPVEQ